MLCTLVCWKHRKLNPINVSKFYSFFLHSENQHPRNLQGHHAYANPVLALAGAQAPWPKWGFTSTRLPFSRTRAGQHSNLTCSEWQRIMTAHGL